MSEEPAAEIPAPVTTAWDDVHLVHDALPATDAANIDLSTKLLGRALRLPLVATGMTGGHGRAIAVNDLIARVAEQAGIAVSVGSQRASVRLASTYAVVRQSAPGAFLIAGLGLSQLVEQDDAPLLAADDVRGIVKALKADALALHLDVLDESIRPGGRTRVKGAEAAVRALVRTSGVPIIATESGAGIARATALRLRRLGVKALDVGGAESAAIAGMSASERDEAPRMSMGERFRDWGMPAPVALVGASAARLPMIASGVRSGVDAAKALALGAIAVEVGRPLLQTALQGEQACLDWLAAFELELRTAIFLSGLRRASDLVRAPVVITGRSRAWLDQLGYRRATTASRTARSS